ncbi:MAG: hypothetical protein EBV25_05950 [Methylophilaceae bacterium]|nr:hypothetical protein [Methylophilaceae bacterium]
MVLLELNLGVWGRKEGIICECALMLDASYNAWRLRRVKRAIFENKRCKKMANAFGLRTLGGTS